MAHKKHMSDAELLQDKVKDIHTAMLTTVEPDGSLRSRPMVSLEADTDGSLWFLTLIHAPKVEEVQHHREVNLSYVKGDDLFVSISGSAELVQDQKKIQALWKPSYKMWFEKGVNDPDLALIKVTARRAEYWDPSVGKAGVISHLFKSGATETAGVDVKLNIQQ